MGGALVCPMEEVWPTSPNGYGVAPLSGRCPTE
jgi:hypothetical protein